jgi:hypothetical protein
MTEAERAERQRRRETRHRERDSTYDSKSGNSRRRRNVHVDVVDKLDVTGLYGVGWSE